MDFLERLKAHTESLAYTPPITNIGVYTQDKDSIAIRPTPSSISTRYISKGKIYPFAFQILVHYEKNLDAYTTIQKLLKELEGLSAPIVSVNNSFSLISMKSTTLPNFVEDTSHGTLWTALFEAELYV